MSLYVEMFKLTLYIRDDYTTYQHLPKHWRPYLAHSKVMKQDIARSMPYVCERSVLLRLFVAK